MNLRTSEVGIRNHTLYDIQLTNPSVLRSQNRHRRAALIPNLESRISFVRRWVLRSIRRLGLLGVLPLENREEFL